MMPRAHAAAQQLALTKNTVAVTRYVYIVRSVSEKLTSIWTYRRTAARLASRAAGILVAMEVMDYLQFLLSSYTKSG